MREFFKGWRRKVGCGLLVMALAVFAMWARSRAVYDRFLFAVGPRQHDVLSIDDSVLWFSWDVAAIGPLLNLRSSIARGKSAKGKLEHKQMLQRLFGDYGLHQSTIPYWYLTLPPALLSGYLSSGSRVKR